MKQQRNPYEDILYLSRPKSNKHPPMPLPERAAQFSPFSALSGYHKAVEETAKQQQEEELEREKGVPLEDI